MGHPAGRGEPAESAAAPLPPQAESGEGEGPATSGELERLAEVIEEAMRAARYSPAAMRAANQHDLRLVLRRLALTSRDSRRILGLFRRMICQMERGESRKTL
jgi:tRNA C32,U32 (ribose-2'-O)-methylase TrmJ